MPVTRDHHTQRGTCSSCGATILWVVTPAGHRMPLDPSPVTRVAKRPPASTPDGELPPVAVVVTTDGRTIRGYAVPPGTTDAEDGRASHFSTCPNAARHRRVRHG